LSKSDDVPNFIIVRPVRAESFQANGQRDNMTKPIVAFRNFANASEKYLIKLL
jgi:hypothetical protein